MTTKRWGKRVRVWARFADGTSESMLVPAALVSRIAPVVSAAYPSWTEIWVEGFAPQARENPSVVFDKGDRVDTTFAADLREIWGGSYDPHGCKVCGCCAPDSTRRDLVVQVA